MNNEPPAAYNWAGGVFLEGQYSVELNSRSIGKVQIKRCGLYYRIRCRCTLPAEQICRLTVHCGNTHKNLGILVPMEDGFGLDRKVPVKEIGEGKPSFTVTMKQKPAAVTFIPICDEEPFAYISRLKESFLIRKDGHCGIDIEKQQEH